MDSFDWPEGARAFFEASPDPMAILCTGTHQISCANSAFITLFGRSEHDLAGTSFLTMVESYDMFATEKFLERIGSSIPSDRLMTRVSVTPHPYLEWSASLFEEGLILLIGRDVTESKIKSDELYKLAHYDTVTGLPNRLLFRDRAQQGISQARREQRVAAIVFLDLDDFKPVNDTYGHAVGDEVLKETAKRLKGKLRDTDTVTRHGGDEFVVFLSMLSDQHIVSTVLKRLVSVFDQTFQVLGKSVSVSCSHGVGVYPDDGVDIDTLLHVADDRMYFMKERKK